ncbi:hypothetical protein [Streptomyces sp. NBC_01198]|uniref:hypothetical protein n=1 Tax=Streptomyces sp. NBC_01198 TaxID=2903769 RepID=UPI002E149222|nr:hypothetical protein OG702_14235 [Streptomyces sp. NBC_01198]
MRGIKGAATGVVAATSVLALAACGPLGSSASGGDKASTPAGTATTTAKSPLSGVAHAVDALDLVKKAASGVHSAKVESTISLGTTMTMTSKGALDWGHGLTGTMKLAYSGGSVAESLRQAGAPTTMDARYLPDAYYVNMGPTMATQLGGRHWIKYSYDDLAKLTGGAGSYLKDTIQNNNPVKSVDAALASPDSKAVGTQTVRGVQTTHYTSTVDVEDFTGKQVPNLTAAELSELRDTLAKAGVTSETIDLWVSKDNLPVEALVTANTKSGTMKTTTYYSDFGTSVTTEAPAASDSKDFGDLMKEQQQDN